MAVGTENIKFSDLYTIVNGETHNGSESISLSDFRGKGSVPISGEISIESHFKGKTFSQETSLINEMKFLVSELNNLNNSQIQSKINEKGFTIFAKIKNNEFAELLSGISTSSFPYIYNDNEYGFVYNTSRGNTLGSGENLVKQKVGTELRHFMAMAIYSNNTDAANSNFEGILLWTFSGSNSGGKKKSGAEKTINNIASLFINDNFNSSGDYWSVYPYFISKDGSVVEGGESGWRYSNNQQASSNTGYYTTSRFSNDDGAWAIQFGGDVDGNNPGGILLCDSSSY